MSLPWPNWTRAEWERRLAVAEPRHAGDVEGHPFYGNQWTGYHGTRGELAEKIKREGLQLTDGRVYVSTDEAEALSYAMSRTGPEEKEVALVVVKPEARKYFERRKMTASYFKSVQTIPPDLIKEVRLYDRQALLDQPELLKHSPVRVLEEGYFYVVLLPEMRQLGAQPGHEFYGNQWTAAFAFKTREDADAWGKTTQTWVAGMSQAEKRALDYYTVNVGINEALRAGKPLDEAKVWGTQEQAATIGRMSEADALPGLDSLFAKPEAVLKEDVVTHRAWSGRGKPSGKDVGQTFVDKGFVSTAMADSETNVFHTDPNTGKSRDAVITEIRVPKGSRALYVGTRPVGEDWYSSSSELLLNRNTRFRVLSTDKQPGKRYSKHSLVGNAKHVVLEVVS